MNEPVIRVKVSGEWACVSRPECKVERMSYECLNPSAARGILDAILWRPQMRWVIQSIKVLKPIRFQALKRNEVQSKVGPRSIKGWMADPASYHPQPAGAGSTDATPRNTVALRDVAYIIEAEPLIYDQSGDNTPMKYIAMFNRRVAKGRCHHRPSLGCREFAARFEPPSGDEQPIDETRDLGLMLYDIIFRPDGDGHSPVFFQARLEGGVLDTRPETALPDPAVREEVLACSYRR